MPWFIALPAAAFAAASRSTAQQRQDAHYGDASPRTSSPQRSAPASPAPKPRAQEPSRRHQHTTPSASGNSALDIAWGVAGIGAMAYLSGD